MRDLRQIAGMRRPRGQRFGLLDNHVAQIFHLVADGREFLVQPRDAPPAQIVAAIYAASAGLIAAPAEDAGFLLPATHAEENTEPLTPRELDVLEMLAEGLSNKMIAYRLSISEHTAKFHVNSILAKLHAGTRTEAVMRGVRLGLVKV